MDVQALLDKYLVSAEDLSRMAEIWEGIEVYMVEIVDAFYEWARVTYDNGDDFFANAELLAQRKQLTREHWTAFFNGGRDEKYVNRRIEIGQVNGGAGATVESYLLGISQMSRTLHKVFQKIEFIQASDFVILQKLLVLETSIVTNAQTEVIHNKSMEQNEALKELSAPVAHLQKDLLFLPLVGFIDSKRARDLMNTMLEKIAQTQSKVFIIDIAGIGVMDTAVANYLIQITKATKLMGCQTILSGLSSTVAQTIVELGIDVGELSTTGNLEAALNKGLAFIGAEIVHT